MGKVTYKQIQACIKRKHGTCVKTCWIADVKEKLGFKVRRAWNRSGKNRKNPCPSLAYEMIKECLQSQ